MIQNLLLQYAKKITYRSRHNNTYIIEKETGSQWFGTVYIDRISLLLGLLASAIVWRFAIWTGCARVITDASTTRRCFCIFEGVVGLVFGEISKHSSCFCIHQELRVYAFISETFMHRGINTVVCAAVVNKVELNRQWSSFNKICVED